MDGFQHQQARRFAGQPSAECDQPPHQQGGPFWYPPPHPSSSPGGGYQPPPPAPAAPLPPPPQGYHHHPPPLQQHQLWPPPHPDARPHHLHAQPPLPPLPPAPYHDHPTPYPLPVADPHRYSRPLNPPLPPRPHHMPPPPPHASAYNPPNQAWGNPSWPQHQVWEYPERNIAYNNEEDWAARARAWAAAKSATDSHHLDPQFTPIGRMEEQSYAYHEHHRQAIGAASTDTRQQLCPQGFSQQFSVVDFQRREYQSYGPTAVSSVSPSYSTDGRMRNSGDEAIGKDTDKMTSPSQRSCGPSSSIYEQEVPYSYSSSTGNGELGQSASVDAPTLMPSVQEGFHLQSTLPVSKFPVDKPRLTHGGHSTDFFTDDCDKPLEFVPRSASIHDLHQNISYGHAESAVPVGAINNDAVTSSLNSWTSSAASGITFSQNAAVPSGTQIDPSFASQPTGPIHPGPVFGTGPSFPPGISPVMPPSPFGLGSGTSIHNAPAFPGDANGAFSLSERPKKAAVPNWLREEIIKQQTTIVGHGPTQTTGGSFNSIGSEDAAKSFSRADQADSKSIDSSRSTEDGEDDEDDVDAARSAAINQEIKRVLTEVLLKVTDELFDEIATKVLNEDDLITEADGSPLPENHKISPSPPAVPTPKASAKVLVPVKVKDNEMDGSGKNSSPRSPGGDILGLANYASDDGDDDEAEGSSMPPPGIIPSSSHQQNKDGVEGVLEEEVEKGNASNSMEPKGGPIDTEEEKTGKDINGAFPRAKNYNVNHLLGNTSSSAANSEICEDTIKLNSGKVHEFPIENESAPRKDTVSAKEGRRLESAFESTSNAKSIIGQFGARESGNVSNTNSQLADINNNRNLKEVRTVLDKTKSENDNLIAYENTDKMKDKPGRMDNLKGKTQDKSVKRGSESRGSDHKTSSKLDCVKDARKENAKDRREKIKEDDERKRDRPRDKKEDQSARVTKDSVRHSSRRSSSPSSRGRNSKESSLGGHASVSSDEPSENSRKRKLQSDQHHLSPSPTGSRRRQVSRSPHSKHSHRRHSPYSSLERRRRSRSGTPPVHHRSTHKR